MGGTSITGKGAGAVPTTTTQFLQDEIRRITAYIPKTYLAAFIYTDLIAHILTVEHNLNVKYVVASIYDENNVQILPSNLTILDVNTLQVDLISFPSFVGT